MVSKTSKCMPHYQWLAPSEQPRALMVSLIWVLIKVHLFYVTRDIYNADNDELLATVTTTSFARGNGGFDGPATPAKPVHKLPDREPDTVCDLSTTKNLALHLSTVFQSTNLMLSPVQKQLGRLVLMYQFYTDCAHSELRRTRFLGLVVNIKQSRCAALILGSRLPSVSGETIRTEIWQDNQTVSHFEHGLLSAILSSLTMVR